MNKSHLVAHVAEELRTSKLQAALLVETVLKGIQKGLTGLACALGKESNTGHLSRIRSGEQNLPAWDLMAIQRLPGRRVPPEQLIQLLKEENRTLYYPLLLLATAEFDESEPPVENSVATSDSTP